MSMPSVLASTAPAMSGNRWRSALNSAIPSKDRPPFGDASRGRGAVALSRAARVCDLAAAPALAATVARPTAFSEPAASPFGLGSSGGSPAGSSASSSGGVAAIRPAAARRRSSRSVV
jgi:hypothetical protein